MPMSRPTNTGRNRRGGRPAVRSRYEQGISWAGAPTSATRGTHSKRSILHRTLVLMAVCGVVMFIPLGWKLWDIAIVHHDEYQKLASDQQALDLSISAQRGNIYDRNGNVMAMSATVYSLILSPNDLVKSVPNKDADGNELDSAVYQANLAAKQEQVLNDLMTLLPDLDRERVNTQIHATKYSYREIKTKIEEEDTEALRTYIAENKTGAYLYLLPSTKRYYPYSSLAAQALGFVNSEGGAYGIEAVYNDVLEGTPGRVLTNKTAGGTERYNTYAQYVDAVDGCNLTLTIDATIQSYLEKTLDEGIRDFDVQDGAFGIAMDPKTGAILGIASSPDFDPNSYSKITNDLLSSQVSEDAAALFEKLKAANTENITDSELMAKAEAQAESNALNTQWRSKAIDSRYEPGSTFKALVLAAALEEGLVSESDHFYCSGSVQLADHTIHCSRRQGHLDQDLAKAVGNSCNPAFMEIGKRLGKDKFYEYFEAFGLMENTGIDLPGEASLKGAIWAKEKMGEVELATASFGQRFEVTPLQMICGFAAVINGGNLVKPYVVQSISTRDGTVVQNTETEIVRQVISAETSQRAADILEKVVSQGTGKNAYVAGYRIGGKTGTSEVGLEKDHTLVSFMGYAPADDPQVIVLIAYDKPQPKAPGSNESTTGRYISGGNMGAPTVGRIMADVLPYLGVEADYSEQELQVIDKTVPDVKGMSLTEAQNAVTQAGLTYRVIGEGETVTDQLPTAYSVIASESQIILYAGADPSPDLEAVPSLINYSYRDAALILSNYGLFVQADGSVTNPQYQMVSTQSIPEGEMVEHGTVVHVTLVSGDTDILGHY